MDSSTITDVIDKTLNERAVNALLDMICGSGSSYERFKGVVDSIDSNYADYSDDLELRVQKQEWKEQLAANIEALKARTHAQLDSFIKSHN